FPCPTLFRSVQLRGDVPVCERLADLRDRLVYPVGVGRAAAVRLAGELGHLDMQCTGDRADQGWGGGLVPALNLGDQAFGAFGAIGQFSLRQAAQLASVGDTSPDHVVGERNRVTVVHSSPAPFLKTSDTLQAGVQGLVMSRDAAGSLVVFLRVRPGATSFE